MAQTTEGASESVKMVAFSFMTNEEVRKHSAVKITAPILLDGMGRPVSGGLYDPAMGSLDETTLCKSCGQRPFYCPGHCGHIDLVSPVYNPLLFIILHNLLQCTCFSCHHFRAGANQVEKCKTLLELILNGQVVEAKQLKQSEDQTEDSELLTESSHSMYTDERKNMKPKTWTSLQFSEAISVVNKFLKHKQKECKNCGAKNPKITKPTFGWLHMSRLAGAHKRANAIRGCKPVSVSSGTEGISSLEEETTISHPTVINILEGDAFDDTATKAPIEDSEEVPPEIFMQKNFSSGQLMPSEVKDIMKRLWKNEATLCSFISDIRQQGHGNRAGYSMFFLESVLVPPIKFRPPAKGGDSVMEHPQTVLLNKVLQSNISLGNAHANKSEHSKIVRLWMDLQQSINILFDSKTAAGPGKKDASLGICQLLEKKEGMFRQKMMGKRVNFACRSVISPDPYLAVNEIGIPPYFALRLTYPERVTAWNVQKLRNAIINGPEIHPGATHYIDKLATVKLNLKPSRKSRISISRKLPSSRGVVVDQGSDDYEFEGKIVNRHLQDGDIVLVNRQPTLHKPSIMAHVVRVLKGEKTIRMHYANCSTYNADFDGDEMNVHFPQDEISRAEAYNIVNANNQYVKPTSGEPIRALIQDHIISAVLLTKKDTFLNFDEFSQLLYSSGITTSRACGSSEKPGQKIFTLDFEAEMLPVLPAVWKPEPLWTGKQVVTALLNHITRGSPPFCVEKDVKIPRGFFKCRDIGNNSSKGKMVDGEKSKRKRTMNGNKLGKGEVLDEEDSKKKEYLKVDKSKAARLEDDSLLIFKNELVRGVIDKAQFGDYGLVHTVQELYGSNTAGLLLSVMSRLFTVFLQTHGFTCGVDDLLLIEYMDKEREKQLQICEKIGEQVHLGFLKVKDGEKLDPMTLQLNIEKTISNNGESALTSLDRKMTSQLNERTGNSKVLKDLLSEGLLKPSVKNCISLMTTSGAKGGTANFQQISSHLGQQQLEGKRVPRMVSGKTLPCFPPWDWASRAGGFIVDRFLTGLRPQEYYFHCMAGREGLVDTAVKTSRSGYLQRCLIKNLESLKICYDHTVRDADGSVIQFQYGEDGVDVHKTAFITKFEALAANQDMLYQKSHHQLGKYNLFINELPSSLQEKAEFIYNSLSKDKVPGLVPKEDFVRLLENKYLSSLAQPGEPVGVLAAQSIGEPSTQMTLNTFHHAGRGEMNVTLGIPRLQEILMTASQEIKTPIMTCPLREGYSMDVAKCLANKLKKITVADIIESMNATVVPFSQRKRERCSIYKLRINFYPLENNPQHAHIPPEDLKDTLENVFVRALEDLIENEMHLLSKINGIRNFVSDSQSKGSSERDEFSSSQQEENDDDDDLGNDLDVAEDLGSDMKKQKLQATDEMDYEDDSEDELDAKEPSTGFESEVDQGDEAEITNDDMMEIVKGGTSENQTEIVDVSKSKSKGKTTEAANKKKKVKEFTRFDYDRSIFVEAKGNHFEVHFKFTNEPHILLTQIAQRAAQKVSIQSSGKIIRCQQITCKEGPVIYHGNNVKERKNIKPEEKEKIPALQTSGVDFMTLWELQDELDVRYIYSNDIHAMLQTYGVEAARETIIREIQNIFTSYGISVNMRHLTLVADYMTHSGGYRPMSRLGGIADSISPFSRMTFETASKFIVQAAFHGEVDTLETPSARICLGLPAKMGTGSFDLMQKIEV
ncbi:DNA-directed RNA polymerase I subunit 1 [Benincasa hispida]|uniref:DNA-directed RNA polymerase I subunit 1 n=1 Tax=Benincasa hispida TaxID=102211 RepID=UPI001900EC0A|nr:DNA-directed RNA polymerase I subunit 1 [Benincasa hispida]XP_038906282.1 DNA-directed RNA polymerase I subunit 1 [Benincasa hispida]XP_038906283.1 DNA-directed RNA polymerase I subunit 1 [Benincasa hispida]XP_038906284.1 DNA-directed RNA polymerase I subunit 1 [Benincasa hispida]